MANHMLLTNGSIRGRDWQFETESGPWCDDSGRQYCRIKVREQPETEHLPCGVMRVYYDNDNEPFATYRRLVNTWNRQREYEDRYF